MKWVKPFAIGDEYVCIPDKVNNHERSKDCIVFNFRLLINVSSMNINNLGAELSTT